MRHTGSWSPKVVLLFALFIGLLGACAEPGGRGSQKADTPDEAADAQVLIDILHLNDVYELEAVSGGTEGGLARVAGVRAEHLAQNPNTLTILAGDLLNPSALSTATVDGERLAGRQMVDVMNTLGLDYATFGNHEFDLNEQNFRKRLAESEFTWFSSNVSDVDGQPFAGVPRNVEFTVEDQRGNEVRVGMFGLTVGSNPVSYVRYRDPLEVAAEQVAELRPRVDVLIAVTHLLVEDDIRLVQQLPEIDVVLGGHEHENMELYRGDDFTPVLKADANARSIQVHELVYDTEAEQLDHSSTLRLVTADDEEEPEVRRQVDRWVQAAFDGFREQGFEPERVTATATEELDGRESSVRNRPTRLTDLIAEGMLRATGSAELAIFNSGSVRIDDVIPAGPVTEYDVIRILPFGGTVLSVEMPGTLLQKVLDQGRANIGIGGYLQTAGATYEDRWLINGEPLDTARTYTVAINDFLLSGNESGLDFLKYDPDGGIDPGLSNVTEHGDIRTALIEELKATFSEPAQ